MTHGALHASAIALGDGCFCFVVSSFHSQRGLIRDKRRDIGAERDGAHAERSDALTE